MGLRFQQQSAEIRALQLQAYNIAIEKPDAAVKAADDPAKLAVVTDLDETVIDNTPCWRAIWRIATPMTPGTPGCPGNGTASPR